MYEAVTSSAGVQVGKLVTRGDIVVLHDPQPLGMVKALREQFQDSVVIIFRSRKSRHVFFTPSLSLCLCLFCA